VGAWFATRTRDEALTAMRAASVTAGPVYTIADAASDTHFRDRGIIVEVEDRELGVLPMHNIVPRLSQTPGMRKFDVEDLRLLESMGRFASGAYQAVEFIEDLKSEFAAREKAEMELRELTVGLEAQVLIRTAELDQRNKQLADARARLAEEKLCLERSEAFLAEGQRLSRTGTFS